MNKCSRTRVNYREIYRKNYGLIPTDETGRTYEIHHIDGNSHNNDPSNLKAVSIQEHYDIHYQQKDWAACLRIAAKMGVSQEELSNINRIFQKERIAAGVHQFLGPTVNKNRIDAGTHNFQTLEHKEDAKRRMDKLVEQGVHPFQQEWVREKGQTSQRTDRHKELKRQEALNRLENGTHNFQTKEHKIKNRQVQLSRIENGDHPWLLPENRQKTVLAASAKLRQLASEGKHQGQVLHTCPHCGYSSKGPSIYKTHFDNCKFKTD